MPLDIAMHVAAPVRPRISRVVPPKQSCQHLFYGDGDTEVAEFKTGVGLMSKPKATGSRSSSGRRKTTLQPANRPFRQALLPDLLAPAMFVVCFCLLSGWWFSVHYAVAFQ